MLEERIHTLHAHMHIPRIHMFKHNLLIPSAFRDLLIVCAITVHTVAPAKLETMKYYYILADIKSKSKIFY